MADDRTPERPGVPDEATAAQDTAGVPTPDPSGRDAATVAPEPVGPVMPGVAAPEPDTGYTAAGVPTLEGVREKIETRYGTALGATELAEETPEGRAAAQRYDEVRKAAAERLEEIRASMREPEES